MAILQDHTAGDPMREGVKWTNLSRRQIARQLKQRGTPASKNVVSRLLYEHGYRRRKAQRAHSHFLGQSTANARGEFAMFFSIFHRPAL